MSHKSIHQWRIVHFLRLTQPSIALILCNFKQSFFWSLECAALELQPCLDWKHAQVPCTNASEVCDGSVSMTCAGLCWWSATHSNRRHAEGIRRKSWTGKLCQGCIMSGFSNAAVKMMLELILHQLIDTLRCIADLLLLPFEGPWQSWNQSWVRFLRPSDRIFFLQHKHEIIPQTAAWNA